MGLCLVDHESKLDITGRALGLQARLERKADIMTKNPTCADLIATHLSGRVGDMEEQLAALSMAEDGDQCEQAETVRYEYPLHVGEMKRCFRLELSTGGPADWMDIILEDDGSLDRIMYHYQDWGDGAVVVLDGLESDIVEQWLEPFIEYAAMKGA